MFYRNIKSYGLFILLSLFTTLTFAESQPKEPTEAEEPKIEAKQESPHIARSSFTSAIQNREPTDQLNVLSQLISEVFFFTELKNYQGHTLIHQWSLNGVISHSVPFTVTGKRWRVNSSKTFKQGAKQEGTWTVKVLDTDGSIIKESQIDYLRPSTPAEIEQGARKAQAISEKKAQDTTTEEPSANSRYTNMVSEVTAVKDEGTAAEESTSKDSTNEAKETQTEAVAKTDDEKADKEASDAKATPEENKAENAQQPSEPSTETKETQSETTDTKTTDTDTDTESKRPVWDRM